MGIIKKTLQAEQDLLDIWLYIARDNEAAADKLYDHIEEVCSLYSDNPLLGPERPELYKALRSFPVKPYVIFYCPIEGGIEIIRVLHGSRDISSIFEAG